MGVPPFKAEWYNNFIAHSSEKGLLIDAIKKLLSNASYNDCLEIGLGTSTAFADALSPTFKQYFIVEREEYTGTLPKNVTFIRGDFETTPFTEAFDVILASHVVYYFNDLSGAITKMMSLLTDTGRIYFVVNGRDTDYGRLKLAFGEMINVPYVFTYDLLHDALKQYTVHEHTVRASLSFDSFEDLHGAMQLSFDQYPEEYEKHKDAILGWFADNIDGNEFFLDQKIIEVSK